uniref:Dynein light chain n=1 Tax=Chenopodium quinoa TaxID=63459 RepID=A0A803MQD1_CHEQI
MNATSLEKQKKGNLYVYKFATEGRKSTSNSEEIEGKGKEKEFPFPITKDLLQGKGEGARKSVSHVENNVAYVGKFVEKARKSTGAKLENDMGSAIALLQVKVLVTDMPAFMQIQAFQCARNTYDSLEKFSAKHIAFNLKKEFDKVYGPAWHCIVGSSFGSFVTHATGCFLYFSMEKLCILLFRTKVQRALQ